MASLNRDEWCEMWESIKTIENIMDKFIKVNSVRKEITWEIRKIKDRIQSVIGQME